MVCFMIYGNLGREMEFQVGKSYLKKKSGSSICGLKNFHYFNENFQDYELFKVREYTA